MALVSQSFHWTVNADGTFDGSYPGGDKPPNTGELTWDLGSYLNTAGIDNIIVGTPFSYDVRQHLQGAERLTASISLVLVSGTITGFNTPGTGNNLTHNALAAGSGSFRVQATGTTGSVNSGIKTWACTSAASVPGQPTGNLAIAVSDTVINQSWDATPGATSYKAKRGGVVIASGLTATTYQHTGLTASTSYSFTVVATNATGDSVNSAAYVVSTQASGSTFNPAYPRMFGRPHGTLLNYTSATVFDDDCRHIAKHHICQLVGERVSTWVGGTQNIATLPAYIKQYNSTIKLLKYVNSNNQDNDASVSASEAFLNSKLSAEQGGGGNGDWWKRNTSGANIIGFAANKWQVNITLQTTPDSAGLRWPTWFARYWDAAPGDAGDWVNSDSSKRGRGLKEGAWDGIFADSQYISKGIFAPANCDYNNDGVNDPPDATTTKQWVVDGLTAFIQAWRTLHSDWILNGQYGNFTAPNETNESMVIGVHDGGLIQDISLRDGQGGGWPLMMSVYRVGMSIAGGPKVVVFHNKLQAFLDDNLGWTGTTQEKLYRAHRYGMCSCLMDNGYYAIFAPNTVYPEYDENFGGNTHTAANLGYLGYPTQTPRTVAYQTGVFLREFDNGCAIVNPKGNGTRTITLPSAGSGKRWDRISGLQAPSVNSGATNVTSVIIQEQDGIILKRITV